MCKTTELCKVFFIMIILFFLMCCQNNTASLTRFNKDFRKTIDKKVVEDIKNMKESSIPMKRMFYKQKDRILELLKSNDKLNEEIDSHGTLSNDAKAVLLLTSFHRTLNNKKVRFVEQVKELERWEKENKKYWEEIEKCDEEKIRIGQKNFAQWNIGDTLHLTFPVYSQDNIKNAFYYPCPSDYIADTSEYISLTGVLINKSKSNFYEDYFDWEFYLQVVEKSKNKTLVLLQRISVYDTLCLNLGDYGRLIK